LLVSWLFHDPDFEITKGVFPVTTDDDDVDNIALLLQMAHKYEIPAMAKDIGVPTSVSSLSTDTLVSTQGRRSQYNFS